MTSKTDQYLKNWIDHSENPLIEPPFPEFIIADPTVALPTESPDGKWHLFANSLLGIHHYTSNDGIRWERERKMFGGLRPYLYKDFDIYYLLYEYYTLPPIRSCIALRFSTDLRKWSEPKIILEPSLPWECRGNIVRTCGNPCLIRIKGGRFRLYYSANLVFLPQLGFCEPLHIGVAEASDIDGPYKKLEKPVLSPSKESPYRNLGAGAIKVIYDEESDTFYGFNNGIYKDLSGKTRSSIMLLSSKDGINWSEVYSEPIIFPEGSGWKKALVYQLDVKKVGDEMWLWYNARSGWRFGKERIGLAISKL